MRSAPTITRVGYAPIVRVDQATRDVELCATSEALDSHGTVFDYAASKDAFTRWVGNVREMHDRRAVGTRVAIRCDDDQRKVFVRVRISRGAEDTWQKVLDGTLRGASIGASNVTWERQRRTLAPGHTRTLNVATRYDLVELSLVDNPSNPDALGLTIVRDAQPDTALLDPIPDGLDAESAKSVVNDQDDAPATRPSGSTQLALPNMEPEISAPAPSLAAISSGANDTPRPGALASVIASPAALRDHLHAATEAMLRGCGCPYCAGALTFFDAAQVAQVAQAAQTTNTAISRAATATAITATATADTHALAEVAIARTLAAGLAEQSAGIAHVADDIHTLRAALETTLAHISGALADLGSLHTRVAQLEAQPLPGGPMPHALPHAAAHTAGHPIAKAHPLASPPPTADALRALESLAGRLRDPQAQVAVAAELIRLQQEGS